MSQDHRWLLLIEIEGQERRVLVPPEFRELPLSHVLRREELPLNTRCGGRQMCEGCRVDLREGRWQIAASGEVIEGGAEGMGKLSRACEVLFGPVSSTDNRAADGSPAAVDRFWRLLVPRRSLISHRPFAVSHYVLGAPSADAPLDERLKTEQNAIGLAVDLGTTTVVMAAFAGDDGRLLGSVSAFNRQMHLADDVLARISLCSENRGAVAELQSALVDGTLAPMLDELLQQIGADGKHKIRTLVAAGNTTMLHLLRGIDPSGMGIAPFEPVFRDHVLLPDDEAGTLLAAMRLETGGDDRPAGVHLLPGSGAYLGADVVGGVVSSGMRYQDGITLLVDIGTNGEIVLKAGERMLGCATAAGPAFEGGRLRCGMRAAEGAISVIRLRDDPLDVEYELIGGFQHVPQGLCGTAYIDFLAEASRIGLLNRQGRFDMKTWEGRDGGRLHDRKIGRAMMVLGRSKGRRSDPIETDLFISEVDVAQLLMAKAAIAAGILTLLAKADLEPRQVDRVYLAGGFGLHLNIQNAINVGLLPGFSADQIQVVGNTSLGAAWLAMMDRTALKEMRTTARAIEVVELNLEPGFEDRYIDELALD